MDCLHSVPAEHRHPLRDSGADALVRIVEAIHRHGLLGDYNAVIQSLGLMKDPIIKNGKVHLIVIDETMPAALLGDGSLQLLILLAGLVLARRQPHTVLILEEPETGLRPGFLMVLADNIARAAVENPTALIALSTHGLELIRFIAGRAKKHGVLDRVKTVLISRREVHSVFKGRRVLEALEEIGTEPRGI